LISEIKKKEMKGEAIGYTFGLQIVNEEKFSLLFPAKQQHVRSLDSGFAAQFLELRGPACNVEPGVEMIVPRGKHSFMNMSSSFRGQRQTPYFLSKF
jgi:hypothetical protein